LAAAILRAGGLLAYGKARMRSPAADRRADRNDGPRTLTEKILARHLVRTADTIHDDGPLVPGAGGFVRADWRFIHEYYTGMCTHMLHEAFGKPAPLVDRDTIVAFEDHLSYSHRSPVHITGNLMAGVRNLSDAHRAFVADYGIRAHGYLPGGEGSE